MSLPDSIEYRNILERLVLTGSTAYGTHGLGSDYLLCGPKNAESIISLIFNNCETTVYSPGTHDNYYYVALHDGTLLHLRQYTGKNYQDKRFTVIGDEVNNIHFITYDKESDYNAAVQATKLVRARMSIGNFPKDILAKDLFMAYFSILTIFHDATFSEIMAILDTDTTYTFLDTRYNSVPQIPF